MSPLKLNLPALATGLMVLGACASDAAPTGTQAPGADTVPQPTDSMPGDNEPSPGAQPGDTPGDPGHTGMDPEPTPGEVPPSVDPGTTPTPDGEGLRFVVLGDGGEGNDNQYLVGSQVAAVCAERGCEFALYLGDNFYDTGVSSVEDEQFDLKFEMPYAELSIPFYVVLGNHDYGGGGIGLDLDSGKAQYQIDYSDRSSKWTLPAAFYTFEAGGAQFFGLDTNSLMWGRDVDIQADWLSSELAASDARWTFAFGHHPYLSNGSHGNAGNYEGLPSITPIAAGTSVRDFMEDSVCGAIDVYFAGHDHTRQWLEPKCGTQFFVSGAAAKTTDLERRDDNPVRFEDDGKPGFLWVEIQGDTLNAAFFSDSTTPDYEDSVSKAEIAAP